VWRVIGSPGIVLADGRLAALWRPKKSGRRLELAVEPLEWSADDLPRVEAEAQRMAPWRDVAEVTVSVR
jgi:hypothetical protein